MTLVSKKNAFFFFLNKKHLGRSNLLSSLYLDDDL